MRLDLLDLFDTVLQHGHHGALVTQAGQPGTCGVVLSGLDRQDQHIDRAGNLPRTGVHRTGHHDGVCAVSPELDPGARSVAAQQRRIPGLVQQRGDRRSDGTGSD